MFWEKFVLLCNQINKSPNAVCADLKFSNATATHWKQGAKPNSSTLQKIADYFNVNVSYFSNDIKEKPTNYGELSERKKDFIRKIVNMSDSQFERLEQILALVEQKEL